MDLKVEQPSSNIITTIGHLQQENRVSEILSATLNDIQIKAGVVSSIFTLDPAKFTYHQQY